ncbi:MAG: tetratricopeptide repeat protein [bacterium]|nr:tetratricopeptide repeat protein [bacterium]
MSHDRMIRYFEMQQDRRPRARFFIPLADLYRATGRLEAAAALLEEGLGRCADSLSARVVLARVRRDQGRLAEARDLARDVLDRDPGHREAPRLLAAAAPAPAPTADLDAAFPDTAAGEAPPFAETGAADAAPAPLDESSAALQPPASEPAPEPEPAASAPVAETGQAPRFLTQTLAEIYLAQGHRQKALAILRRLLTEHPERDDVAREIATLEAVDAAAGASAAAGGAGEAAARTAAAAETAAAPADPNRARFDAWVDRQQGGPA